MTISKYRIIEARHAETLEEKVNELIKDTDDNWQPLGPPFSGYNGLIFQAVAVISNDKNKEIAGATSAIRGISQSLNEILKEMKQDYI